MSSSAPITDPPSAGRLKMGRQGSDHDPRPTNRRTRRAPRSLVACPQQEEHGCDDVVPVSAEPSKPYIKVSRCLTGLVPRPPHRPFAESCFPGQRVLTASFATRGPRVQIPSAPLEGPRPGVFVLLGLSPRLRFVLPPWHRCAQDVSSGARRRKKRGPRA